MQFDSLAIRIARSVIRIARFEMSKLKDLGTFVSLRILEDFSDCLSLRELDFFSANRAGCSQDHVEKNSEKLSML